MRLNRKLVAGILAVTAIAFDLPVYAEPACGKDAGVMRKGDRAARTEQHLAQLRSQLKLTAEQEPLWQAFADRMMASVGQGGRAMADKLKEAKTAPEGMAMMMDIMKARMSSMESIGGSFNRFYDVLTPEQKTIVDKYGVFAFPRVRDGKCPPEARKKAGEHG